jgi:site-specific DNA-methyltransferase (adenine-specific)
VKRNLRVHFSSASAEWATPQWLFDALDREFGFALDPCATAENAKCSKYFTAAEDGLRQSWDYQVVFMNPPYGRVIGAWMRKAWESSQRGATVVCLVPARTDTDWWHRFAMRGEVRLLKGRLRFGNAKSCAPFPSAIVVFRPGAQPRMDTNRHESGTTSPRPSPPGAEREEIEGAGRGWTRMSPDRKSQIADSKQIQTRNAALSRARLHQPK